MRAQLAAREQAGKLGGRDDRYAAVMRGLEILVAGDEILGRRVCGHQIEERPITLIAQHGTGWVGDHKLCFGSDRGQKNREIDPYSGKGPLEFRSMDHGGKFRKGGWTHVGMMRRCKTA